MRLFIFLYIILSFCSERRKIYDVLRLGGHALHFNEPSLSAYGGLNNDTWLLRESLLKELPDDMIVGNVTQVDDDVGGVVEGAVGLGEESFYVVPHTLCLTDDVAFV